MKFGSLQITDFPHYRHSSAVAIRNRPNQRAPSAGFYLGPLSAAKLDRRVVLGLL